MPGTGREGRYYRAHILQSGVSSCRVGPVHADGIEGASGIQQCLPHGGYDHMQNQPLFVQHHAVPSGEQSPPLSLQGIEHGAFGCGRHGEEWSARTPCTPLVQHVPPGRGLFALPDAMRYRVGSGLAMRPPLDPMAPERSQVVPCSQQQHSGIEYRVGHGGKGGGLGDGQRSGRKDCACVLWLLMCCHPEQKSLRPWALPQQAAHIRTPVRHRHRRNGFPSGGPDTDARVHPPD